MRISDWSSDVCSSDLKADVALDPGPVAIARRILAVAGHYLAAFRALFQDDVDDAGKSVRAVLCRGTVAQHLDAFDGADRDRADVHALGALADLAERQHQREIGRASCRARGCQYV